MNERDERKPTSNVVVGYMLGKAIFRSDDFPGHLFFCNMEEGTAVIGEHIPDAILYPIMLLSAAEEQLISERYGKEVRR